MNLHDGEVLIAGLLVILSSGLLNWPTPLWYMKSVPARACTLSIAGILVSDWQKLDLWKIILIVAASTLFIIIMDRIFPVEHSVNYRYHFAKIGDGQVTF